MKPIYLFLLLMNAIRFAHADTRDQIRTQEIHNKVFGSNNYETQENKKVTYTWGLDQEKTSKALGFRSAKSALDDMPEKFQAVLKVSCADADEEFLPSIPRNRPVNWIIKKGNVTLDSGSAHVDTEGYARFVVSNIKPSEFKKIKIGLNSEEKEIDRQDGPFDLRYKRKTCLEKKTETKEPETL